MPVTNLSYWILVKMAGNAMVESISTAKLVLLLIIGGGMDQDLEDTEDL